ncbi:hypothetical protein Taro_046159, partial [Colocasia esculenta]|nr:hypothetical protein [Colocasia esculenta]
VNLSSFFLHRLPSSRPLLFWARNPNSSLPGSAALRPRTSQPGKLCVIVPQAPVLSALPWPCCFRPPPIWSELQGRDRVRVPHSVAVRCLARRFAVSYMSTDASAAEASEVLDLNADAAAVDSQEQSKATVADETKPAEVEAMVDAAAVDSQEQAKATVAEETKPAEAEAMVERSVSTGDSAGGVLNGGGRVLLEGEGRGAAVEARDTDAAAAVSLVTVGWEASEGAGADIEGQDGESSRPVESSACQSTEAVIFERKAEAAVDHVDWSEGVTVISLKAEDRIVERNTESGGGESSGANLGVPVGSEVGIVNSQATDEKDDREDPTAADLISAVASVKSDESENVCPCVEYTVMAGETTEDKVHVAGNSAPVAEINPLLISQASDDQSCDCPTKVDVSSELPDDRGLQMREKLDHTSGKPPAGDDASLINAILVDNLQSKDQNDKPVLTSTNANLDTCQVTMSDDVISNKEEKLEEHPEGLLVTHGTLNDTESAVMSGFDVVAEEHLKESSHLGQNLSGVFKGDLAQVNTSASQSTEVLHVGSDQDSQPSLVGDQNVSLTASADLGLQHESTETGIILSEEMSDQEVKLNKKEDDGLNKTSDVVENKVAGFDTVEDGKELNLEELVEKEDKSEKCSTVNPDAADVENKHLARYHLPQDYKASFSISDLVWGKVKSHPWWPGQILDPADASDMALKHQKRDNFLVGYFGDKTFAWCDESKLKPFEAYFSQLESQSSSDAFINAVNSTLPEVSRRMELGMSCSCVSEGVISSLKHQKIENAGIREGSSCSIVDKSSCAATFEPYNFLEYIKALALYPCGGMDKLGLVIAKSQMTAFSRLRSHTEFPVSISEQRVSEYDVSSPIQKKRSCKVFGEHPSPTSINDEMASDSSAGKRKKKSQGNALHRQKHIPEHGRKQKSLSELMDDKNHYDLANGDGTYTEMETSGKSFAHSSGKKRKKDDTASPFSGKSKRKRLDALGDVEKKTPTSDRSFKVGECISRIASKLTGSLSIIKCNGESVKKDNAEKADQVGPEVFDVSLHTPEDTQRKRRGIVKNHSSPEEMLSQLCLAAKDPMKGYSFLSAIVCFFTEVRELRDSGLMVDKRFEKIKKKRGRKKKSESHHDSNNKLSGAHSPSTSAMDEKSSQKIGRKRGRKKKSESKNDLKTDATETSALDYMADSYWTDRIVCGTPEEKSLSSRRKRKGEFLIQSPTKKTKPSQESLTLSKMLEAAHHLRISAVSPTGNRDSAAEKQATFFGEKSLEESTPTALILSFSEPDALPSETNLIRIFSRYGPLKETETEVLRETNSAKVVFKKHADAELAFSSAGKYCLFGPDLVSYRLRNLPSTSMVSPELKSDGRKERKIMDDVLETPAQGEVNELVQKEAHELAQKEAKESAQDGTEEFIQEEVNELAQDEVKDLVQDKVKELCQEQATILSQEESKELSQAEMKESTEEEAKELAEDEMKDLAQDEVNKLTHEEAKGLTLEEAKELVQEEIDGSVQEVEEELVQDEMKDLTQDEVKELCQEEVQELTREEAEEPVQDEMKNLTQDEVKELCQEEVQELTHEEAEELFQDEMKDLTQDEMKELFQEEVQELTSEEANKSAQAEIEESTQEQAGLLVQDEMNDSSKDEVKKLCQEEVNKLCQNEIKDIAQDEVNKLCQEEVKELAREEVKELAQGEAKESTEVEAK